MLGGPLSRDVSALELLKRPEVSVSSLYGLIGAGPNYFLEQDYSDTKTEYLNTQVSEQVAIQHKYQGYIARQSDDIARNRKNEAKVIPEDLDFSNISGLSNEIRQKLSEYRPQTLGQASRIPGVTPAAISVLLVHIKRLSGTRKSA